MRLSIEVEVRRGPIAESRHRLHAAVCDARGGVHAATADPGWVTTFRSAAKPFQLLPFVERGHADRLGCTREELAVFAASHTGSREHLALVSAFLDRTGFSPADLACGYHDPLDSAELDLVRRDPSRRSPLHNNCSGKHAAMLALARAEGWPTAGYHRADHPVQQLMTRTVAELCAVPEDAVATGVDGCSVVVFGVPLAAMARAYATLAAASAAGTPRERALAQIGEAMRAHPRLTGGEGRFSTVLMEAAAGALLAKGGAEGLECVAVPGRGLGLAVKCEDGAARALPPAVLGLLDTLDLLPAGAAAALAAWRSPRQINAAGLDVGSLEAVVTVAAEASR